MDVNIVDKLLVEHKAAALGYGLTEKTFPPFRRFARELILANEQLNLFSRKMTEQQLVENHLFDCLLALPHFAETKFSKLADFGTGGGMPGLILAIAFPDAEISLFEKSPKKCDFLSSQASYIQNIKIELEIGDITTSQFDLITARAFKPIDSTIRFSRDYFEAGGQYLLYKAKKENIELEIKECSRELNFELKVLDSPFLDVERHLVQFCKA